MENIVSSGCFSGCNSIIYFNKSSINEYKWDIPSGQELLLYRKLSEIIYDVENTLTTNINNDLSLAQVLDIVRDASATIRKYISDYIGHLFTEKEKLDYQLTEESLKKNATTEQEFNLIKNESKQLTNKIKILINCEYVWNVAEIFWIDTQQTDGSNDNNSILITLKFLDVMNKFRDPANNNDSIENIEVNSDKYWQLLYKHAMYGNLAYVINEIDNFQCDHFTKKLLTDLCNKCPIYNALRDDIEEEVIIPSNEEIITWKNEIRKVKENTEYSRVFPLLEIFSGNISELNNLCNKCNLNWLDWIYSYLYYSQPFIDHKNELYKLVTLSTNNINSKTSKGSIEWMFGCIMTNEYVSILEYSNKIFPLWFSTHLCYFLRRLNTNLIIEWPRQLIIKNDFGGEYNNYILQHPKMTIIEWIFEYYVEYLLNINNMLWIWLKNYLYFFKRRGLSMLRLIFENIEIPNDKYAYKILQCINEFNLSNDIYNSICLRMAHKSYINNMQYGRITYWCCKCIGKNNNITFNKYLFHIIRNYLNSPANFINILHDICDNASVIQIENNKLLNLIILLRDMYLCRYDLQKLDAKYNEKQINININTNKITTPFSHTRGKLIDEILKSTNNKNKNIKQIADSFDIMSPIHTTNIQTISHSHSHSPTIQSPFPKSVLKNKNKTIKPRDFLLNNLITPPRPTPSRNKKSHRTSKHKSLKSKSKSKSKTKHEIDEISNIRDEKIKQEEKNYEIECCDIIISYIKYLMDIITTQIYDFEHFIPIIIFSLPIFAHKYAPNAITVNNILIITHKWYKIKFIKNNKKTKIKNFNINELNLIQEILAHLQSKVLATTYSHKNYAQIWKSKEEENNNMEQDTQQQHDNDDDDDMIDID